MLPHFKRLVKWLGTSCLSTDALQATGTRSRLDGNIPAAGTEPHQETESRFAAPTAYLASNNHHGRPGSSDTVALKSGGQTR